jgi:hypothetical protein
MTESEIAIALSDDDIRRLLNNRVKIIAYPDLAEYNTLDEVLYPHNRTIILYLDSPNHGHWTALMKRKENGKTVYEMFDPYGIKVDKEFDWLKGKSRELNGKFKITKDKKKVPLLSNLIKKQFDMDNSSLQYNENKFQSEGEGINTCGRHCVLRLMFYKYPLDLYRDAVNKLARELKIDTDELATIATPL